MANAPPDFTDARKKMVDGQVRPNKVSDPAILAASLRQPATGRHVPDQRSGPHRARAPYHRPVTPAPSGRRRHPSGAHQMRRIFALGGQAVIRDVETPEPRPGEVLVRTAFSTASAGTELLILRKSESHRVESVALRKL